MIEKKVIICTIADLGRVITYPNPANVGECPFLMHDENDKTNVKPDDIHSIECLYTWL